MAAQKAVPSIKRFVTSVCRMTERFNKLCLSLFGIGMGSLQVEFRLRAKVTT